MKVGYRKPSIKKSIKARTTGKIKRQIKWKLGIENLVKKSIKTRTTRKFKRQIKVL